MLRIENLPMETPNVASGSIMTLQDVTTTPIKSTINKENPDLSNPYRRSVEASNRDTKRTNIQSEYLKNPDTIYNDKTTMDNGNQKIEVVKFHTIEQKTSKVGKTKSRSSTQDMKKNILGKSVEVDRASISSEENNYGTKEGKSTMQSLLREDMVQTNLATEMD